MRSVILLKRLVLAFLLLLFWLDPSFAADLYWRPLAAGHAWGDSVWSLTDSGAAGTHAPPTATDNAHFSSNDNSNCIQSTAGAQAADLDFSAGTGWTGTFSGSTGLTVNGSLTKSPGMTWTWNGALTFAATTTGKTITSAGVPYAQTIQFTGAGGVWTLQDNLTNGAANSVTVSNGALNTNGKTFQTGTFTSTSGTRTLTLDNSTINITGLTGTPWNLSTAGTLTYSDTGTTYNIGGGTAGSGITLSFSGVTYAGTVNITTLGIITFQGTPTFAHFSYTSSTNKTDRLAFANSPSITISTGGALTLAGNSTVNRAFVNSTVLGSVRNISVPSGATVTLTNVDFQDIASAGTFGTWTGTSLGDCLGNSGITFDASVPQTYAGGTNNWSTAAAWTSRVPLPQDDVVVTSGTVTLDMPRAGRNLNFAGYTSTLAMSVISQVQFFGNIVGKDGASVVAARFQAYGRGSDTITSGAALWGNFDIFSFGGSYTLQNAYAGNSGTSLQVANGTFDSQGFAVSAGIFVSTGTATRAIKATLTSVWSFGIATGTVWSVTNSLTTTNFNATIEYTGNITTTATFAGAGLTYGGKLWQFNTSASGTLIITGANTFTSGIEMDSQSAATLQLPAGVTTTIGPGGVFAISGIAGHLNKLISSSAGTPAPISKASGRVLVNFVSIKDSTATGGAAWFACQSTSVSGNTGWIFSCGNGLMRTGARWLWLLKRDFSPANDNLPAYLNMAA